MAKKKKWKKRLKKLAKAALIGGALYGGAKLLGKRRPSVEDTLASEDANIGVTHDALKPNYITQKADVATDVATDVGSGGTDKFLPRVHPGTLLNQRKKIPGYGTAVAPPGILNPYNPQRQGLGPRRFHKGGGIAKRGKGAAYKSGGRVKSMGIAKRGGGIAKR